MSNDVGQFTQVLSDAPLRAYVIGLPDDTCTSPIRHVLVYSLLDEFVLVDYFVELIKGRGLIRGNYKWLLCEKFLAPIAFFVLMNSSFPFDKTNF